MSFLRISSRARNISLKPRPCIVSAFIKSSGICCASCETACCRSAKVFASSEICFMMASRFLSPLWSFSKESIRRSWLRAKSCAVEANSCAFIRLPISSDKSAMRSSSAAISSRALSFSSSLAACSCFFKSSFLVNSRLRLSASRSVQVAKSDIRSFSVGASRLRCA